MFRLPLATRSTSRLPSAVAPGKQDSRTPAETAGVCPVSSTCSEGGATSSCARIVGGGGGGGGGAYGGGGNAGVNGGSCSPGVTGTGGNTPLGYPYGGWGGGGGECNGGGAGGPFGVGSGTSGSGGSYIIGGGGGCCDNDPSGGGGGGGGAGYYGGGGGGDGGYGGGGGGGGSSFVEPDAINVSMVSISSSPSVTISWTVPSSPDTRGYRPCRSWVWRPCRWSAESFGSSDGRERLDSHSGPQDHLGTRGPRVRRPGGQADAMA